MCEKFNIGHTIGRVLFKNHYHDYCLSILHICQKNTNSSFMGIVHNGTNSLYNIHYLGNIFEGVNFYLLTKIYFGKQKEYRYSFSNKINILEIIKSVQSRNTDLRMSIQNQ